jgi:serine/threonine protein kinase
MALILGTRLGPYEVLLLLGAGGMGEVYRPRDTKLNRDVALKILPEAVASDPIGWRASRAKPTPWPPSITLTSSRSFPSRRPTASGS